MSIARQSIRSGVAPETTYGFSAADAPALGDLQVAAIAARRWTILDARLPQRDPFRVLASVRRRRGVFEVLQLGIWLERHEFRSLPAAVQFVFETNSRFACERMSSIRWTTPVQSARRSVARWAGRAGRGVLGLRRRVFTGRAAGQLRRGR